ncbi:hypothetical protein M0657_007296 [Pyricularia oryzae]|uniref:Uncharacterized protein n=1 Tax=Pyricularia oryzae TaxID=318829 RepID=A0A4P7N8A3_PYROR|nr:hypothetical protein MCOR16_011249 [Pyricularia oryzae]KAI7919095.1 hypothetical protein M0657_007296 [Pyricularia oryzae]KAI7924976.1 hypothetical protein M9X92_003552 [Pyricularia oryzae]QBZ58937.1 hypothetical protein PoMZ_03896 [Pyricularia oryzae]
MLKGPVDLVEEAMLYGKRHNVGVGWTCITNMGTFPKAGNLSTDIGSSKKSGVGASCGISRDACEELGVWYQFPCKTVA